MEEAESPAAALFCRQQNCSRGGASNRICTVLIRGRKKRDSNATHNKIISLLFRNRSYISSRKLRDNVACLLSLYAYTCIFDVFIRQPTDAIQATALPPLALPPLPFFLSISLSTSPNISSLARERPRVSTHTQKERRKVAANDAAVGQVHSQSLGFCEHSAKDGTSASYQNELIFPRRSA